MTPVRRHCVVFLSKNINPSLVLVQARETCLFITERLLMGRKESNQTKQLLLFTAMLHLILHVLVYFASLSFSLIQTYLIAISFILHVCYSFSCTPDTDI